MIQQNVSVFLVDRLTYEIKIIKNKRLEEEGSSSPELVSNDDDDKDVEDEEQQDYTSTIEEEPDNWSGGFITESGTGTETEDDEMETSSRK